MIKANCFNIEFKKILVALLLHCCMPAIAQTWNAGLTRSDGIRIPFTLSTSNKAGKTNWTISNASEKIRIHNISSSNDSVLVQMPVFESQFRIHSNANTMQGIWIKAGANKTQYMPFDAHLSTHRFPPALPTSYNISGRWAVTFTGKKEAASVAEFKQNGNQLTGTFLNSTGDYRYLEGIVSADSVFLSSFDGSHAFLFTAAIASNSKINGGTFYSGAISKQSWAARKDDAASLSQEEVTISIRPESDSIASFSFRDINGATVSIKDKRFQNKVVIVQLMGSWCPNCMDETAFLSDYYNKNKQKGIEIISIAYEYSTDFERSSNSLKKFKDRFNVQYPMLISGVTVSDSLRTEKTIPQITTIKFFPSSIIIDKKGKIRYTDTGFNGPATGSHHLIWKKELEERINSLLQEK